MTVPKKSTLNTKMMQTLVYLENFEYGGGYKANFEWRGDYTGEFTHETVDLPNHCVHVRFINQNFLSIKVKSNSY